jgi:indole-3-glycerol phosphate synthase
MTDKPILAKGIHANDNSIELAVEAGADQVLVVGRIPSVYADRCLVEPYSLEELTQLPTGTRAVWNSRDLSTGGIKPESFTDARKMFTGWLCQASNIRTTQDIQTEADAILVGTYLPELAEQLGF